jgi:hypothetical protein
VGNSAAIKVRPRFKNQPALAETMTRSDGSFALAVLPGPGVVAVRSGFLISRYMPALVTARELRAFFKGTAFRRDDLVVFRGPGDEFPLDQIAYHALVLLNPAEKTKSLRRDVALDPGRAIRGSIVGPDGQPVAGAAVEGLGNWIGPSTTLTGADFALEHVNPRRTVELVVRHREKGLGAVAMVRGDEKGPVMVRLRRFGSVTGRLVDRDGQPACGVVVWVFARKDGSFSRLARLKTDRDGRYRFDGLVPGQEHILISESSVAYYTMQDPIVVGPGEVKTVEDLKPQRDN